MSVVRIRESPYYRGFFKEIYENFVGTLNTHWWVTTVVVV